MKAAAQPLYWAGKGKQYGGSGELVGAFGGLRGKKNKISTATHVLGEPVLVVGSC